MAEKKAVSAPAKKPEAKAATASAGATATATATKAAPAPVVAAKPAAPVVVKGVSAGERHRLIAEAAYFLAQRRGFTGGSPVQDWLTAEKNVDAMLARR